MIAIIFKKELLETLRDRRTLLRLILLPILLFPVLMFLGGRLINALVVEEEKKIENIAFIDKSGQTSIKTYLEKIQLNVLGTEEAKYATLNILTHIPEDSIETLIHQDSICAAIIVPEAFPLQLDSLKMAEIDIVYKSSEDKIIAHNLTQRLIEYRNAQRDSTLQALRLPTTLVEPFQINEIDIASDQQKKDKTMEETVQSIGGFIPYVFIIFCFMGCMYPGIDLFTGEKEKGTLETILTAPIARFQLLFAKMGVVALVGLIAATLSIIGIIIGVEISIEGPARALIRSALDVSFNLKTILLLFSLLVPLSIFFAGLVATLATQARSFKEAVSSISPLNVLVILPATGALISEIELTWVTAIIPILNISIAAREILSQSLDYSLLLLVYASLILLAVLSVRLATQWFGNEKRIWNA